MQLYQLQYFCTVARCRNMSRAADELFVSQSALSKAISSLEEELGVKLFDRVGRRIQLNEAGQSYYNQISHCLQMMNDATNRITQIKQRDPHEVRVLFTASTFIASHIRDTYEARYPNSHIRFICCYSPETVQVEESDFHIFASPAEYPELATIKLLEEEMLLAFGPKHPLAKQRVINLIDTAPYEYMCLPPQENIHENLTGFCLKAGFEPKVAFCTEDSFAFFGALGSSSWLTLVPSMTAYAALNDDILVKHIHEPECKRTIYLGYHKDREMSEDCKNFMNFCIEFFNRMERSFKEMD